MLKVRFRGVIGGWWHQEVHPDKLFKCWRKSVTLKMAVAKPSGSNSTMLKGNKSSELLCLNGSWCYSVGRVDDDIEQHKNATGARSV